MRGVGHELSLLFGCALLVLECVLESGEEAVQHFQAAVDADPTFAPAYAGLATTYSALGLVFYGQPPADTRPKVLLAARKALELDPELSEARAELGDALQKDWH